jgi:malate dehydrogenase (oxaloacetate-decarboxylating)(NADP+)
MFVDTLETGATLLHDPRLNKGTAFSLDERDTFHLRGLLPPAVFTQEQQAERFLTFLSRHSNDLDKYVELMDLQDRNERLFYRVLIDHLEEIMPLVYTPTVGQACLEYGVIFRRPRGLFIAAEDIENIDTILDNWHQQDVRVIVVTDGERILGLGDLGAHGMGIPVGKLALYTACAGVDPRYTLPILLDVGTENEALRDHPFYLGRRHGRLRGEAYHRFLERFITAVQRKYPDALIQFEDFGNANAFQLLQTYRTHARTFNDDIQGTASVTLAGLLGALKLKGESLKEQRLLFLGAGEAGIGIGDLIVTALVEAGMTIEEARRLCWFVDSKGLVVNERHDLVAHKRRFAHNAPFVKTFEEAIEYVKPTAIIGVSGQPHTFTPQLLQRMAELNQRPIIFALSNPTSKSECTATEAYTHTNGRAIFASGSPFAPVSIEGTIHVAGQANNVYIFPGMGLGVMASGASQITDDMFVAAATVLAEMVTEADLKQGRVFPALSRIREVSLNIAVAVANIAYRDGYATRPRPRHLRSAIANLMYTPAY